METDGKLEAAIPDGLNHPPAREIIELVDNLCVIQAKTRTSLALPADWHFTRDDLETARDLVKILRTGTEERCGASVNLELPKTGVEQIVSLQSAGEPVNLSIGYGEVWAELFDTKIPLGPMIRKVTGHLVLPSEDMSNFLADLASDASAEVKIVDAEIVESYESWIPA